MGDESDLQVTGDLPPMEFDRQRNASLLTRKSAPLDGATPISLSRVGSLQAKHMQKLDNAAGTGAAQSSTPGG